MAPMLNDEPRVVLVLREYREAMAARELSVLTDMAKHWLTIEQRLSGDMAALQMIMAQKVVEGGAVTPQMVWREERYQILKGNLQAVVKDYNRDYLIPTVEQAQKDFAWFGVEAATDAVKASYTNGISPFFPVLNREAVETMAGFLGNGSPLNSLLKNDAPEALDGIVKAMINGVARGASSASIGQEMANGLGMGLEKALLIARTETNRTYRSAVVQEYRASNVVIGFRRLVKKISACMGCLMLDGERFAVESDLYDHPRGNCQLVPEVIGVGAPKWQTGAEWFKTLDKEQQREKLGGEVFDKWQKEGFDLKSLVGKSHSDEWGDAPRFGESYAQ